MKRVEVFSIGDELLRGIVQDTNSHWLIQRITARGARVERGALLPDDPPLVAGALRSALSRKPDLILTHGGLGPTDDDRTREAVSLATGLVCEPHAAAEEIVRRRYAELAADGTVTGADLNEARIRMSLLPRGAIALDNHVGAAPGVLVRVGSTVIVCLPGVPPELFWIFDNSLAPFLDEILGPGGFSEWTAAASTKDESHIADTLRAVQSRHLGVYVKSRAKSFAEDGTVRVTITATAASNEEAEWLLSEARKDLKSSLRTAGVDLEE
ncbi:MAG: competence/damage-inducible protein A [Actinobacteria bacterium]|nr:competence/damage-inducible protein A [Actinomycetota bacterium]